jgi:transcriptional regulator with XRE-family HTH domain
MSTTTRPAPIGVARGRKTYELAELVAYRKARGVTQADLAARLRVSQPYVSMVENSRGDIIQQHVVEEFLDAIDAIAERQAKLIAEGVAALEAIRSTRKETTR